MCRFRNFRITMDYLLNGKIDEIGFVSLLPFNILLTTNVALHFIDPAELNALAV